MLPSIDINLPPKHTGKSSNLKHLHCVASWCRRKITASTWSHLPNLGPKAFAACLFALQDCSRCEANISKHDSSDHLHLQIFRKGSLQALAFTFMYFPLSSSGAEACGITPKSCWTMDPQEGDHVPHKPCTHALTATFRWWQGCRKDKTRRPWCL